MTRMVLGVPNLEAVMVRVTANGGTVANYSPGRPGGLVKDPAGNQIELIAAK
jgi:predicted enzyme related to lactoylglutathione lyase